MIFPILFFVFFSLVPETPYYLIKTDRLEVLRTHIECSNVECEHFELNCVFSFVLFECRMLKNRCDSIATFPRTRNPRINYSNLNCPNWRIPTNKWSNAPVVTTKRNWRYPILVSLLFSFPGSECQLDFTVFHLQFNTRLIFTYVYLFSHLVSRPFSIGVILMILHEFCGCFTMTSYAGIIFSRSGSTLSPSISAIIIGTIQFFGAYISTILVDRLGRKVWRNPRKLPLNTQRPQFSTRSDI